MQKWKKKDLKLVFKWFTFEKPKHRNPGERNDSRSSWTNLKQSEVQEVCQLTAHACSSCCSSVNKSKIFTFGESIIISFSHFVCVCVKFCNKQELTRRSTRFIQQNLLRTFNQVVSGNIVRFGKMWSLAVVSLLAEHFTQIIWKAKTAQ